MELTLSPLLFFDPDDATGRQRRLSRKTGDAVHRERRLFCARCRHPITAQEQRIAVNGGEEHDFTNPHGIAFHIGCFREAPGCTAPGLATTEHTWFPGYAWEVAYCARCGTHMGWLFKSPADGFYGLIMARLTAAGPG